MNSRGEMTFSKCHMSLDFISNMDSMLWVCKSFCQCARV